MRVLIVDDDGTVRDLLRFLFEKDGYEVVMAEDGEAALEAAHVDPPDLVVLDVMLPKVDGFTVFARLSQNDSTRHIPVIVLTGKSATHDIFAPSANIVACLTKPFKLRTVRESVAKALGHLKREVNA